MNLFQAEITPQILPNFLNFLDVFSSRVPLQRLTFNHAKEFRKLQFHVSQKSVGELFTGFLKYFSELDTNETCLTISGKLDRMDERLIPIRNLKERFQPLIIQEPFIGPRNAAFAVNTRARLKKVISKFKFSYNVASDPNAGLEEICILEAKEEPNDTASVSDVIDNIDLLELDFLD